MSSIAYSSHRSVCKMTGQITESSSWREFGGRNSIDDEKQTWNGIRYAQWIFLPFRLVLFLCRVPCEIRMLMTETPKWVQNHQKCWQSCHGCVYVRWFIQSAHGSDLWLPSILITVTLVNLRETSVQLLVFWACTVSQKDGVRFESGVHMAFSHRWSFFKTFAFIKLSL